MENIDKFLKYVKINTQSDDTTGLTPSTNCQKNLGFLLVNDLLELGLLDAHMDKWGNVYAHLPGEGLKIGLNAHMDTALEVSGENVKPQIIQNYQGGDIKLNDDLSMNPQNFPSLLNRIGHNLIVTDGTTLLGADDKAGIAIIMGALQFYKDHPEIKHHPISVAFTVDEEIGEGALHFDYEKMDADFAYTIDGSEIDVIEYENFNAFAVNISVKGVSIHPGEGKNKLINAILVLNKIIEKITLNGTPYDSSEKEGFFHVTKEEGSSEFAECSIIIRDFSMENMENRMSKVAKVIEETHNLYPGTTINHDFKKQYENMYQYVIKNPEPVERARKALINHGLNPKDGAIRGGTDGATFSKNGLITPNLGTGSYNHHGRYEFLDVNEFETMIKIVTDILKL